MDSPKTRLVGDYILGPRIGSGSFAVVYKSRHRVSGLEVAVKEIDKKLLSPKISENLLKEISILSTIDHPNIMRLFESIECKDRIFLVLEYCDGGDLAGYIQKHGKVSENVARHFMRELAAGLQVLQEKHLIHRDLKPQNLLLSSKEATPLLKIGDFGFARSLTPQSLADTLCGSPLYMAPEIIQNQKYDAKADLWSVGAILFQLVTGKPPFDGNNQYQLFQNILTSTELQFPEGSLVELPADCVDLCRKLLRLNPVERLTFKEFFDHRFLREPSVMVDFEQSSLPPKVKSAVEQCSSSASDIGSQLLHGKGHGSSSGIKSSHSSVPHDVSQGSVGKFGVSDSTESIEKGYVLVNRHFTSIDKVSYLLETSLQDNLTGGFSTCPVENKDTEVCIETKECASGSVSAAEKLPVDESDPLSISLTISNEVQGLSILHPSTRLHMLHQYVEEVAQIAQEKYDARLFLESFSVQLVVLAIWKKILQICNSWISNESAERSTNEIGAHGGGDLSTDITDIDFRKSTSASQWAEKGFISACDYAEKLSYQLRDMDAAAEMPDAMETIFQKALSLGTSGAVNEYINNKVSAAVAYSKAMLLLTFVVGEATSLPLNPPFSLTPANKKQIESYIISLRSHQSKFLMLQQQHEQTPDSFAK